MVLKNLLLDHELGKSRLADILPFLFLLGFLLMMSKSKNSMQHKLMLVFECHVFVPVQSCRLLVSEKRSSKIKQPYYRIFAKKLAKY